LAGDVTSKRLSSIFNERNGHPSRLMKYAADKMMATGDIAE